MSNDKKSTNIKVEPEVVSEKFKNVDEQDDDETLPKYEKSLKCSCFQKIFMLTCLIFSLSVFEYKIHDRMFIKESSPIEQEVLTEENGFLTEEEGGFDYNNDVNDDGLFYNDLEHRVIPGEEMDVPLRKIPNQRKGDFRISEHGVVMFFHPYGRTNNQILGVKSGINFAYILNRTFVFPPELYGLYDDKILAHMNPGGNTTHDLVIPYSEEIYHIGAKNRDFGNYVGMPCANHHCDLDDEKTRNMLIKRSKRKDSNNYYLALNGKMLFYHAMWGKKATGGADLEARFYMNLFPIPSIRKKVADYIEDKFKNKEFAAVHLRDLEGTCTHRMKTHNFKSGQVACSMYNHTFMDMEEWVTKQKSMPIFVAWDKEKKKPMQSYTDAFTYDKPCKGTECAVIDFEIAAHANFFGGAIASTATHTIKQLRIYRKTRNVGKWYPSQVTWSDEVEKRQYKGGSPIGLHMGNAIIPKDGM